MATNQQIAANRANAQKSTGPKTPEGRAAVSLNSLKHGLSAKTIVVMGEDPKEFEALWESLLAEHQPATPTEAILVRQLAMAAWRQLRLFRAEAGFYRCEHSTHEDKDSYEALNADGRLAYIIDRDAINENALVNYHRFEVRIERSIKSAIQELRRCRADRQVKIAKQTQSELKAAPNPPLVNLQTIENPSQTLNQAPEPLQDEPQAA